MEQTKHQILHSLTQFTRYQILKRITQLLVSVSVFSFLLCNYSLHFFTFSTFTFQLFSHTLDKNCIFLLCNGLLVFVAKFSGLITSSSSPNTNLTSIDHSVEHFDNYYDAPPLNSALLETEKEEVNEIQHMIMNEQGDRDINEETHDQDEIKEISDGFLVVREEEEKLEISDHDEAFLQEEVTLFDDEFPVPSDRDDQEEKDDYDYDYDYDYEEENGMLNTEELNKKFDDFIRKMKEEIRIEAQQQYLVLVN